jgi:L-ribulose-5-phosphate 3-epimerase
VLETVGPEDAGTLGVTIDTGWFGTQGYPADDAVRALRGRLRHVHLKDVRAAGTHETCGFGKGVVPLRAVVQALAEIGYTGVLSVEHEPELFGPGTDLAAARRQLDGWLAESAQERA